MRRRGRMPRDRERELVPVRTDDDFERAGVEAGLLPLSNVDPVLARRVGAGCRLKYSRVKGLSACPRTVSTLRSWTEPRCQSRDSPSRISGAPKGKEKEELRPSMMVSNAGVQAGLLPLSNVDPVLATRVGAGRLPDGLRREEPERVPEDGLDVRP